MGNLSTNSFGFDPRALIKRSSETSLTKAAESSPSEDALQKFKSHQEFRFKRRTYAAPYLEFISTIPDYSSIYQILTKGKIESLVGEEHAAEFRSLIIHDMLRIKDDFRVSSNAFIQQKMNLFKDSVELALKEGNHELGFELFSGLAALMYSKDGLTKNERMGLSKAFKELFGRTPIGFKEGVLNGMSALMVLSDLLLGDKDGGPGPGSLDYALNAFSEDNHSLLRHILSQAYLEDPTITKEIVNDYIFPGMQSKNSNGFIYANKEGKYMKLRSKIIEIMQDLESNNAGLAKTKQPHTTVIDPVQQTGLLNNRNSGY